MTDADGTSSRQVPHHGIWPRREFFCGKSCRLKDLRYIPSWQSRCFAVATQAPNKVRFEPVTFYRVPLLLTRPSRKNRDWTGQETRPTNDHTFCAAELFV